MFKMLLFQMSFFKKKPHIYQDIPAVLADYITFVRPQLCPILTQNQGTAVPASAPCCSFTSNHSAAAKKVRGVKTLIKRAREY